MTSLRTVVIVVLTVLVARSSAAQPQSDQPSTFWSVTAGLATFSLRDIARSAPPVDASQIAWQGRGESVSVRHDRTRPARLHRYDVTFSSTSRFSYDSTSRSTPADADDSTRWLAGRYEYRRRVLARRLPNRVDVGVGVQALGDVLTMTRRLAPSIESGERDGRFGFAGVAAARFRISQRLAVEGAWINGVRLARIGLRHSVDSNASIAQWGGGWLTETTVRADVSISQRTALVIDYLRTGEGVLSHFHSYASQTGGLAFGLRYGR